MELWYTDQHTKDVRFSMKAMGQIASRQSENERIDILDTAEYGLVLVLDGELFLTDRIKDLFKTSNGKYIAPQMIESLVLVDKFVDQIAIIANERKFVSALIVPEFRLLEDWAKDNGVEVESREQLCQNPKIIKMMTERIHTLQQQLAPYEQIKRFTLIAHHFSMESGELTNTLKIRRPVIYKNFKEVIDKMYEC